MPPTDKLLDDQILAMNSDYYGDDEEDYCDCEECCRQRGEFGEEDY